MGIRKELARDYVGEVKEDIIKLLGIEKKNEMVTVRASKNDVLFVRSLYYITTDKVEKYLNEGTIKKYIK